MRIGVLNNLRAGRSDKQVGRVLSLLGRYPDVRHVETDSAHLLPEALADLLGDGVDLLVLNGGDGTLQFALSEILNDPDLRAPRYVAPLRGGRTNMTALDFGARRDPERGLGEVLEAARSGRLEERVVDRPVLRVSSTEREMPQYGMFFGVGLVHRAISVVHRVFPTGRSQGVFGAGIVLAAVLARMARGSNEGILTPDKVELSVDGVPVGDSEFYLVFASSLGRLFLRMNPFWGEGPGRVRLMSVASDALHLRRSIPGILRGRPRPFVTPENGYNSANATRAELRLSSGFTVDGEIFAPLPDEVVTLTTDDRIRFVRA